MNCKAANWVSPGLKQPAPSIKGLSVLLTGNGLNGTPGQKPGDHHMKHSRPFELVILCPALVSAVSSKAATPRSRVRILSVRRARQSNRAVRLDEVLDSLGKRDEWDKLNFFLQLPKRSSEFFNAFQSSGICESRHVLHELVFCQIAATSVNPRVVQFTLRYVF